MTYIVLRHVHHVDFDATIAVGKCAGSRVSQDRHHVFGGAYLEAVS